MNTNQNSTPESQVTRRDFLRTTSAVVAGASAFGAMALPQSVFAAENNTLKLALIGCGGRGEKAGNTLGEFNLPHGLQVDERGHVWVADRSNTRYQELDNDLKPIREITNLGTGWTLCISPGPHQYIFFSNSNPNGNPQGSWENTGEIYKAEIDGTVIGRFGKPGKVPPGFQVVHMMDCRNPNEPILGEIESWRVQKYILQPTPARPSAGR